MRFERKQFLDAFFMKMPLGHVLSDVATIYACYGAISSHTEVVPIADGPLTGDCS